MLPTNTHILYPEFEYHAPTTIHEATELLAEYGDTARVMAGGTDLLTRMKMERYQPAHIISLQRISALHAIAQNGKTTIGAATSIRALYQNLISNPQYRTLLEACNGFSTIQIMNMATLGGNLCNASPAADTAPSLLVLDARARLQSKAGERVVALSDFFLAPGRTILRPDEMLTQIHIPPAAPTMGSAFIKISRVVADISQVCAAVNLARDGNVILEARIALGSVAPTPFLAVQAASALLGERFTLELAERAGQIAAREIRPIGDVRATREYRQRVARVIVRDAVLKAWERTQ